MIRPTAPPPVRARGPASPAVPLLRGTVVASLTTALALAAHCAGGGAMPSATTMAVLLAVGSATGAAAGHLAGRRGLPHRRAILPAALLLGQGAGHMLLGLLGGHGAGHAGAAMASHGLGMAGMSGMPGAGVTMPGHGMDTAAAGSPAAHGAGGAGMDTAVHLLHLAFGHDPAMLAAHLGATVACALLVAAAESLYEPLAAALRRLVPVLPAPAAPPAPALVVRAAARAVIPAAPAHTGPLTRRGPPLPAAPAAA